MQYDFAGLPVRIKEAREKYAGGGMSREHLGKLVGVSRQAVARWEQSIEKERNSIPDLETLNAIANILRVNFLWLVTGIHYVPDLEGDEGSLIPVRRLENFHLKTAPLFHKRTLTEVRDNTDGFRVPDVSNTPEFLPGDVCVTEPETAPRPGDMMVARLTDKGVNVFGRCTIGGYSKKGEPVFEIVPLNEAFPRFSSDREKIELLAVVVEHHRDLRNRRQVRP